MHEIPPDAPAPHVQTIQQVDRILEELTHLAKDESDPDTFYARMLEHLALLLDAPGVGVWIASLGSAHLAYQKGLSELTLDISRTRFQRHVQQVQNVLRSRSASYFPVDKRALSFTLLAAPIMVAGEIWGALVVYCPTDLPSYLQDGYLQLVEALTEVAAEFQQNRYLVSQRQREDVWQKYREFSLHVHQAQSLKKVAYAIANAGHSFLGSDRVSVVMVKGFSTSLAAVSGIEKVNHKASLVQKLERLVTAVNKTREPLVFRGDLSGIAPQIEAPLHDYLEDSATRQLAIVPITPTNSQEQKPLGRPLASLVVEDFGGRAMDEWLPRISQFSEHAALALDRAVRLRGISLLAAPMVLISQILTWSRLAIAVTVLLVTLAIAYAATQIQTHFTVTVRGELQPAKQQHIFAPVDGFVSQLNVTHGEEVEKGTRLIELKSPELELESKRLWGEIQTARKELAGIDAARLQVSRKIDPENIRLSNKYTAERASIVSRLQNLAEQQEILARLRKQLVIESPFDATVLNWDIDQTLTARPVRKGQAMLTLADLKGEWNVVLDVPDEQIGYVYSASKDERDLPVTFVVATNPQIEYPGQIGRIDLVAHTRDGQPPSVTVEVKVNESEIDELRPGAEVVGRIHCGQKSMGYVWLHPILRELQQYGYLQNWD